MEKFEMWFEGFKQTSGYHAATFTWLDMAEAAYNAGRTEGLRDAAGMCRKRAATMGSLQCGYAADDIQCAISTTGKEGVTGQPKYCVQCDSIRVKIGEEVDPVAECLSNGTVVKTLKLPYTVSVLLKANFFLGIDQEPPKQYSVEDIMKMIDIRRTSGQSD